MHQKGHIVVVEPDKLIRQLLETWLSETGYRIVPGTGDLAVVDDTPRLVIAEVTNPGSAVSAMAGLRAAYAAAFVADPQRFAAVITDESMSGLSGSELIRRVRGIRPELPVLMVSGDVSTVVARRAREAGADDVLKKPLAARTLAKSPARVLQAAPRRTRNRVNGGINV